MLDVTHVVVVTYVNDIHLEQSTCLYTTSGERAQALAQTLRRAGVIIAPGQRAPYLGSMVDCKIVGDVKWAPL